MNKTHLTTIRHDSSTRAESLAVFTKNRLLKKLKFNSSNQLLLPDDVTELTFKCGTVQRTISLNQLMESTQTNFELTPDTSIQLCLINTVQLVDRTSLIVGLLSGVLAVALSIFTESNWREFLFLLGSTLITMLLFMILYKHPIDVKSYNTRMLTSIVSLILIFLFIPMEDWQLKILIGLSTLTFITRFFKDYKKSFAVTYSPFVKQ